MIQRTEVIKLNEQLTTTQKWNKYAGVGILVHVRPVESWQKAFTAVTRSEAWICGETGKPVILLDGRSGPIELDRIEVI
jgi:hypothetical protein